MDGWIKLYKKLSENWMWKEKPFSKGQAWIDLLLSASHPENKLMINGKIITVKTGEYFTSIDKLAAKWGWSEGKIKRFLGVLESEQMITAQRSNRGTTVNVLNYGLYQGLEIADEPPNGLPNGLPNEPLDRPQNKNKEHKNKEYIYIYTAFFDLWNGLERFGIEKISMTEKRDKSIGSLLEKYSEDDFKRAIENIKCSDFLQGKTDNGWKASFDWFVKSENFKKVLNGNYNAQKKKNKFNNYQGRQYDMDDLERKLVR